MSISESLLNPQAVQEHPVRSFLESRESVLKFSSHFKRTNNPLIQKYIGKISSVLEGHIKNPTDAGNKLLSEVAADCRIILEASQKGERHKVSNVLPEAYGRANEYSSMIREFGLSGLGSTGTLTEDSKYSDEHSSFCKKFCKEFGVEADHFDEVAEGLFIYFDANNTDKLLRNLQFDLSSFSFDNGYIMLKAGSVDDFSFGSFGEELSKWSFVYLPESE